MTFLRRDEWRDAFADIQRAHDFVACRTAGVGRDEVAGILGQHAANTLWGCAFEDFLSRTLSGNRNMVDDYLKRRSYKESASAKAYMKAIRESIMSLYEVSDIVPGQSFLARDLIRGGEPVLVSERSATAQMKPWDRIGARIVPLAGGHHMCGGLLVFDLAVSERLLAKLSWFEQRVEKEMHVVADELGTQFDAALHSELTSNGALLRLTAPIFTRIWLSDALEHALNPSRPELYNTDGDPYVSCTLRFPLRESGSQEAVCAVLDAVDDLRPASDTFFNWLGPEVGASRLPANFPGRVIISSLSDGDGIEGAILASIEVEPDRVVVTANSRQRIARAQAKIEAVLAGSISAPLLEIETPEDILAKSKLEDETAVDRQSTKAARDCQVAVAPDVERRIVHGQLDEHYRMTLDKPLTMLDGLTPRQAANSAEGRDKVASWLKYLENQAHHRQDQDDPLATYDPSWLWRELGIQERRV